MKTYDSEALEAIHNSKNMLVPWYLMASYVYYQHDKSLLSDYRYDKICKELLDYWDEIEHRHKDLIDCGALRAGTGYQMADHQYPSVVKGAAMRLLAGP